MTPRPGGAPAAIAPQALALRARPSGRQPRHALPPGDQSTSTPTTTDARCCEHERRRRIVGRWWFRKLRCCRRDRGLALWSRPAGGGFKPPTSALAEDRCGERRGKRRDSIASGVGREDERWTKVLCR